MKVQLKCFSTLAETEACDYREAVSHDIPDGATVAELLRSADIPEQNVKLVFVNGRAAGPDAALREGDRVGIAPAVGGM